MIFDFKDHLTQNIWHNSDLVTSPPKSIKDYKLNTKSFLIDNSNLAVPFVVVYAVLASLITILIRLILVLLHLLTLTDYTKTEDQQFLLARDKLMQSTPLLAPVSLYFRLNLS